MIPNASGQLSLLVKPWPYKWTQTVLVTGSGETIYLSMPQNHVFFVFTTELKWDYSIDGSTISCKQHCKDLGMQFSSDLLWSDHYNSISAKAYQTLGLLRQSFSSVGVIKSLSFDILIAHRSGDLFSSKTFVAWNRYRSTKYISRLQL